jgi:pyruvate decarboxylase
VVNFIVYIVIQLIVLSGVAGSLAERLPILHIVGAPSTALQVGQASL